MLSKEPADAEPSPEFQETLQTLEHLEQLMENLLVRGLCSIGSQELNTLAALEGELSRVGAAHLASRLGELRRHLQDDPPAAAAALLNFQAGLRVFERILTQEWAAAALAGMAEGDEGGECS